MASPIFDGMPLSLPIPYPSSNITFEEAQFSDNKFIWVEGAKESHIIFG